MGSFKRKLMLGGIEACKVHFEILKIQDKNKANHAAEIAN